MIQSPTKIKNLLSKSILENCSTVNKENDELSNAIIYGSEGWKVRNESCFASKETLNILSNYQNLLSENF